MSEGGREGGKNGCGGRKRERGHMTVYCSVKVERDGMGVRVVREKG